MVASLALAAVPLVSGCSSQEEARGPAGALPAEVAALIPSGATLCHEESGHDGDYQLWIYRAPGGNWISFPTTRRLTKAAGRPKAHKGSSSKDYEQHSMPPSALESVLKSRLPSLDSGRPLEPHCRYTHWRGADGAELQIRELLTDQGWFASVERVRF